MKQKYNNKLSPAFQASKENERKLGLEVERLKRISERQSANLAQALKEKNDKDGEIRSLKAVNRETVSYLRIAKGDRDVAQAQLRDIKNGAKVFFRAIGVGS